MSTSDPAATYAALRDETAGMLKLDAANLSLVEGLQLDLIALLRLTTSDMQGAALSGEAVDLDRLSTALGMLQKLLPEKSLVAAAPAAEKPNIFAGAREELSRFFAGRASAIAKRDERNEAEMVANPSRARAAASAEFEAKLAAAIAKHGKPISDPTAGDEALGVKPFAPEASIGGGSWPASEHPLLVESPDHRPAVGQTSPPPPPPRRSVEEINAEPPPAHYLKQDDSPWRRHLDADGNIIAPYFRPGG